MFFFYERSFFAFAGRKAYKATELDVAYEAGGGLTPPPVSFNILAANALDFQFGIYTLPQVVLN